MQAQKRDYALDLLKVICTVIIVLHHYESAFATGFSGVNFGDGYFHFGFAVEMFFIISGYFSYSSIRKIQDGLSFDKYFSARVLRLLPVPALSTAIFALLNLMIWRGADFSVWKVFVTMFGVMSGGPFDENFINSHLWYLSVLLICYAVFFIAVRLSQRLRINWRYACFAVIMIGVSAFSYTLDLPFLNTRVATGYMAFFTGLMLASLLHDHELKPPAVIFSLAVTVVFTLLIIFKYEWLEYGDIYLLIFVYFPAIFILFRSLPMQKLTDHRIIGILGQISFNVYIWHLEINTFMSVFNDKLGLGINFHSRWTEAAIVLLDLAVGTLSFFLIERPISGLINRRLLKKEAV